MEAAKQTPMRIPQIFISHARIDERSVLQVERTLTVWGIQPWVDRQQLAGGQEWQQRLQLAIEQSAALIVVITPAALTSPMVRREYLYALSQHKPVLVLHFKPVPQLPAELAGLPAISFHGNPLKIGPAFYMLLEDQHLLPAAHDERPVAVNPADTLHLYANRIPADWEVFRQPISASWWRVITFFTIFALLLVGTAFSPQVIRAMFGEQNPWLLFIGLAAVVPLLIGMRFALDIGLHLNIVLGRIPRDSIILTPTHCTVQIFTFDRRRITILPYRYLFQPVTDAATSTDRRGRTVVTLTYATGASPGRIVIPRRWTNRRAIAARIMALVSAAQSAQPIRIAPSPPTTLANYYTAPQVPMTTYCCLATSHDQPILQEIQTWLTQRGCVPDAMVITPWAEGLILPTEDSAVRSRFVFVLPSPTVMQSPQCLAIIDDLRRQGKLVIPIRTTGQASLPDQIANLQWVDFGPRIDRARSFLDLCDTLDHAGALPIARLELFDAELALARAIHERVPAGWYACKPDASVSRQYRIRQISSVVLWMYPLGIGALLTAAVSTNVQNVYATNDPISATIISGLSILILVTLCAWLFLRFLPILLSSRLLGRLINGYHAPECVVITPNGIAFHALSGNGAHFVTGGYAFASLQQINVHTGLLGALSLHLVPKQGKP